MQVYHLHKAWIVPPNSHSYRERVAEVTEMEQTITNIWSFIPHKRRSWQDQGWCGLAAGQHSSSLTDQTIRAYKITGTSGKTQNKFN
jgi:hypothetical protein